jgi:phospholipid/cholesterol/gamma-HCH transport system substrate-binding protein
VQPRLTGRQERVARTSGFAALVLVVGVILFLLFFNGNGPYMLHAHFADAGQLVPGDLVEVGAGSIGTVDDIKLTDNGQADVVLKITDGKFTPFHRGTIAQIRAVGLASVANRFVEIAPGPGSGAKIDSGGSLGTAETRGIVDLDVLLDELTPSTRANLQTILKNGADAFAYAKQANQAFGYLNPALSQTAALGQEVVRDQSSLQRLISSSATVVDTLASRQSDLVQGVANTAATLRTVASQDAALQDSLGRAPAVFSQAIGTLRSLRGALQFVNPTLHAARPVAPRLARLLRQAVPATNAVLPAVQELRAQLPALRRALAGLPGVAAKAGPAVQSATTAIGNAAPIYSMLRPYAPDLAAGLFNGFGGSTSGPYDANGHYSRITVELGQGSGAGLLSLLPGLGTPSGGGLRTGLTARCPGGAATPAADKSNPYVPDPTICNPANDSTK